VGVTDVGGASTATRMVGGFILVALLLCILLAWPGRRRWPIWLIAGLPSSLVAALAFSLGTPDTWWWLWARGATILVAVGFVATGTVRDLRDPSR
jgi:hypothetical protein